MSQVVFSTNPIMLLMRPGEKRHGAPAGVASEREFSSIQSHIMVVNTDVLNSWKEVATYLGRGIRTVQRWERELGLPIRRPRGKPRGRSLHSGGSWTSGCRERPRLNPRGLNASRNQEAPQAGYAKSRVTYSTWPPRRAIYNVWFGLRCPERVGNRRACHHIDIAIS